MRARYNLFGRKANGDPNLIQSGIRRAPGEVCPVLWFNCAREGAECFGVPEKSVMSGEKELVDRHT